MIGSYEPRLRTVIDGYGKVVHFDFPIKKSGLVTVRVTSQGSRRVRVTRPEPIRPARVENVLTRPDPPR